MRDGIADCGLRICVLPAQSGPEEEKRYQWRILVLPGFSDFLHSRPLKGLSREHRNSFFILNLFFSALAWASWEIPVQTQETGVCEESESQTALLDFRLFFFLV